VGWGVGSGGCPGWLPELAGQGRDKTLLNQQCHWLAGWSGTATTAGRHCAVHHALHPHAMQQQALRTSGIKTWLRRTAFHFFILASVCFGCFGSFTTLVLLLSAIRFFFLGCLGPRGFLLLFCSPLSSSSSSSSSSSPFAWSLPSPSAGSWTPVTFRACVNRLARHSGVRSCCRRRATRPLQLTASLSQKLTVAVETASQALLLEKTPREEEKDEEEEEEEEEEDEEVAEEEEEEDEEEAEEEEQQQEEEEEEEEEEQEDEEEEEEEE
jgi:hypothetical protein